MDSLQLTDSDIPACLDRVKQGEETAMRALIDYMYPLVFKIARSNASRRNDEEDLVQAILTKVFRGLDRFSGQVPFRHWVSRVAVNACMDAIRREKHRPEVSLADLSEQEAQVVEALAASDDNLDPALGMAARDLVQALVSPLRPMEKLLVRLVYLEGFSGEEAAAATGLKTGAVNMRLSRAREKMRARYGKLSKENAI